MKLALAAITKHGVEHARKLLDSLPQAELWVSEKQKTLVPEVHGSFAAIKDFTASAWDKFDGLIYFVSLGAVVRTIAPFLKSKDEDPAVVVVDDACRFAVSVLSGHVGGANQLAERVAAALGCQAVLTTASDARATIPVDILGRELGWRLEPACKPHITPVSASVVNEQPIAFVQECGERNWWTLPSPLPKSIRLFSSLAEARQAGSFEAWLLVSDRATASLRQELAADWPRAVIYRPRSLCCGIGFDFGTSLQELEELLEQGLGEAGLSPLCLFGLASIDLKQREEVLFELAEKLKLPVKFFTREELNAAGTKTAPNPKVMHYTGAVGVCEPSAMLAAGASDLALPKIKSQRATLAIARIPF